MIPLVLTIGVVVALAAWMSHGDETNWFQGTVAHVGIIAGVVGVIIAVAWVMEYGT